MALSRVDLRWGDGFGKTLALNDLQKYAARTEGLMEAPDIPVQLAPNIYDAPTEVRATETERVFKIMVRVGVNERLYDDKYFEALDTLKAVLGSGPLQIAVDRTGIGTLVMYCRYNQMQEQKQSPGDFEIEFTAADPVWYLDAPVNQQTVTQPATGAYLMLPINYDGTAPAEPVITLTPNANGGIWTYQRSVTVTNPGPNPWSYYPVCIQFDSTALVAAGHMRADGGDIRLRTTGGVNKDIYVRNPNTTSTKVWTIIYSLAPGASVNMTLLYGNAAATADPEATLVRPMFSMPNSDNTQWQWLSSMPIPSQSQNRNSQWHPMNAQAYNIHAIDFVHPDFTMTDSTLVPCFGAYCPQHLPAGGYAGVQFNSTLDIASLTFDSRLRTNGTKTPFVIRTWRPGTSWADVYSDTHDYGQRTTVVANTGTGTTSFVVANTLGINVGDSINIDLASGGRFTATVTAVNSTARTIAISAGIPSATYVGAQVSKYPIGAYNVSQTLSWASGTRPRAVAIGLRGDHMDLTSGEWYYGASETVSVAFDSTQVPTVTLGAPTTIPYLLQGTISNDLTGESISLSMIAQPTDKLVIDCKARTVTYYAGGGGTGVSMISALSFPSVSRYWISLRPQSFQNLMFSGDWLYTLTCKAEWETRYY